MANVSPSSAEGAEPTAAPRPSPEQSSQPKADLVLEGGGVKGIGLVGAVTKLASKGYAFPRVAGSSAGAIVGALVAASMATGNDVQLLEEIMRGVDYTKFRDRTLLDRLGLPGEAAELFLGRGIYKGEYLVTWLEDQLDRLGIRVFADLRISEADDPGTSLAPDQRYRLVVTASDVTRGQLVRLPWDCQEFYGIDPDTLRVVDAVRASMSIPFFFHPAQLPEVKSTFVDGGMLSNFPVEIFDRSDGKPSRWPTYGVKLSARRRPQATMHPTSTTPALALACLETLIDEHDAYHLDDAGVIARTVFVDTTGVSATDFGIDAATQSRLFANGQGAAEKFLAQRPEGEA
jgi:NTE family protein